MPSPRIRLDEPMGIGCEAIRVPTRTTWTRGGSCVRTFSLEGRSLMIKLHGCAGEWISRGVVCASSGLKMRGFFLSTRYWGAGTRSGGLLCRWYLSQAGRVRFEGVCRGEGRASRNLRHALSRSQKDTRRSCYRALPYLHRATDIAFHRPSSDQCMKRP